MAAITQLLLSHQRGDLSASDALLAHILDELRELTEDNRVSPQTGGMIQPAVLVREAWLRLVEIEDRARFQNHAHFLLAASDAVRRIMLDRARSRRAESHGAEVLSVSVSSLDFAGPQNDAEVLFMHRALKALALHNVWQAAILKLTYFAGLNGEEIAQVFSVPESKVKHDLAQGQEWTRQLLHGN